MHSEMISVQCTECGGGLVLADRRMAEAEAVRLKAKMPSRLELDVPHVAVGCPRGDSYVLGIGSELGVPIYSDEAAAFLTVHGWDWWNADPVACDIRSWPDFGCLTFSPNALRAAVRQIAAEKTPTASGTESPDFACMAAVAGLPTDASTEDEWHNQARLLSEQTALEFSSSTLDRVAARLCRVLVQFNLALQPTMDVQ